MNAPPRGGKPPAGGGGGGRNKGRNNRRGRGNKSQRNNRGRNNNNNNNNNNRSHRRGPPQSPQTKVMLRNIGNAQVHGNVAAVADMIRNLVSRTNERLTGAADQKILLDEESLLKLVENDKLATEAMEEWKNNHNQPQEGEEKQDGGEKDDGEGKPMEDVEPQTTTENTTSNKDTEKIVTGMNHLDINKVEKSSKIFARPLYAVPPKKTRRRGEKPGNAYLVLTTPPIPAVEQPATPTVTETSNATDEETKEGGARNDDDDNNNNNAHPKKPEETAEVPPPPPPPPAKVDYSRPMAERQLALVRAVEVMTAIAAEDARGDQVWGACQVREAGNPKSWRPPQRRDHREGTVQDSPGFQAFTEMTAKEKEDLQARPKPAPGGGLTTLSTGLATSDNANNTAGKPVAALVLHLQNKHEQENVQKKNKRKAKDSKKKAAGNNDENGKVDGVAKKRGRQKRDKKRAAAKKAEPKP